MASNLATWASALVAACSLVVAIVALIRSSRAQSEANANQQRIVEIEEQREVDRRRRANQANFQAHLRETRPRNYRLVLTNRGMCKARNVRVEMDGKPLAEHPAAVSNDPMPNFVGPDSEISCLLGLHMQCAPPFKLKVTWDDDYGKDRVYCTTLTF